MLWSLVKAENASISYVLIDPSFLAHHPPQGARQLLEQAIDKGFRIKSRSGRLRISSGGVDFIRCRFNSQLFLDYILTRGFILNFSPDFRAPRFHACILKYQKSSLAKLCYRPLLVQSTRRTAGSSDTVASDTIARCCQRSNSCHR